MARTSLADFSAQLQSQKKGGRVSLEEFQRLNPDQNHLGFKTKPVLGEQPKPRKGFFSSVGSAIGAATKPIPEEEFEAIGKKGNVIGQFGIGAGKEFIRGTGATLSGLGERTTKGLGRILTPKKFEEKLGFASPEKTAGQIARESEFLEPKGTAQKAGAFAESIGEFFVPGAAGLKVGKGAKLLPRIGTEAATFGGVSALQEGELGKEQLKAAALGGAFPVVGKVGAGAKKFLGKTLPESFTKAALNLTKNQKVDIKNISSTGESAESFLLRNKIGGEPAQISKQLLSKSKEARANKLSLLSPFKKKFKLKEASKITESLIDDLAVPGLEKELAKVVKIADDLAGGGTTIGKLDELKSLADQFASPFKLAGTVKEAAKSKGFANLRGTLQEFIEVEAKKLGAPSIKAINNEIRLTRKIGEAVSKQEVGAGGNAVAKLSDLIVGGSVLGGAGGIASGNLEGFLKGAILGTGAALLRRTFTPKMKIKLANGLSRAFNKGEAGKVLRFLNGGEVKLKPEIKKKLADTLVDVGVAEQKLLSSPKAGAIKEQINVPIQLRAGSTIEPQAKIIGTQTSSPKAGLSKKTSGLLREEDINFQITGNKSRELIQAESDVLEELAQSVKGQRVFSEEGVSGLRSTFPNWVPDELRLKKLFDSTIDAVLEGKDLTGRKKQLFEAMKKQVRNKLEKKGKQFSGATKELGFKGDLPF